jgi:hypothetical protein
MKSSLDQLTQRILTLLKIDAQRLLERITDRKQEYVEVFALRRTREHFPFIFDNRYSKASVRDLSHCSLETITAIDQFYHVVDEMRWYLYCTEDMPNTVDDYVTRKIARLKKLFQTLEMYIDAELGIKTPRELLKVEVEAPEETRWVLDSEIDQEKDSNTESHE